MAATLDRMAGVARTAFQALLPPPPRNGHASSRQLLAAKPHGQGQGNGHASWQQPEKQEQENPESEPHAQALQWQSRQQQAQEQQQQAPLPLQQQQPGGAEQHPWQQAAPATGEALPSPFVHPLPAATTPPLHGPQREREDVVIEMQGGAHVVLRSLRTRAVPRRSSSASGGAALVLSPRSVGGGSVRRRRSSGGNELGSGEAATAASPRSEGRRSDVTAGLSIIATVGRTHTFKAGGAG